MGATPPNCTCCAIHTGFPWRISCHPANVVMYHNRCRCWRVSACQVRARGCLARGATGCLYDRDGLRRHCSDHGIRAVIPYRRMHRRPRKGLTYQFDNPLYRKRNVVERLLGWLKEKRHLTTRFDKLKSSFRAMITLGCILKCARAYFSYRT